MFMWMFKPLHPKTAVKSTGREGVKTLLLVPDHQLLVVCFYFIEEVDEWQVQLGLD